MFDKCVYPSTSPYEPYVCKKKRSTGLKSGPAMTLSKAPEHKTAGPKSGPAMTLSKAPEHETTGPKSGPAMFLSKAPEHEKTIIFRLKD